MKIDNNVIEIDSSIAFVQKNKMRVSETNIAHVIASLTNMYQNPVLAIAREYISNAYDATVARMGRSSGGYGVVLDTPVEVVLPTALSPDFVVRDYGVGMSAQFLGEVFSVYGDSMKRDSNDEIGGFGLGAKSAFSLVNQFIVVSVQNGRKNTAIVQKDTDGVGSVNLLEEVATDEADGTTVRIPFPAESVSELNDLFRNGTLLLGYPVGSVSVNGRYDYASVHDADKYVPVAGRYGWVAKNPTHSYSRADVSLLVGPVHYTVPVSQLVKQGENVHSSSVQKAIPYFTGLNVVLNVPIGSVDLTPARDNLIMSDRTKATIFEAVDNLYAAYSAEISDSISTLDTPHEVLSSLAPLYDAEYPMSKITYKGVALPEHRTNVDIPALNANADGEGLFIITSGRYGSRGFTHSPYTYRELSQGRGVNRSSVFVHGVDTDERVQKVLASRTIISKIYRAEYNLPTNRHSITIFTTNQLEKLDPWEVAKFETLISYEDLLVKIDAHKAAERAERKKKQVGKTNVTGAFYVKVRSSERADSVRAKSITNSDYVIVPENLDLPDSFFDSDSRNLPINTFYKLSNEYRVATNRKLVFLKAPKSVRKETLTLVLETYGNKEVTIDEVANIYFKSDGWGKLVSELSEREPAFNVSKNTDIASYYAPEFIAEWFAETLKDDKLASEMMEETIKRLYRTSRYGTQNNDPEINLTNTIEGLKSFGIVAPPALYEGTLTEEVQATEARLGTAITIALRTISLNNSVVISDKEEDIAVMEMLRTLIVSALDK